ncbi:MAG: hypothetical protein JXR97_14315 [Planctomycetes bacterium]|nr:hypothetical protein [Planctomycetota bacterium]
MACTFFRVSGLILFVLTLSLSAKGGDEADYFETTTLAELKANDASWGPLVSEVEREPAGAAAKAGLLVGDIVLALDGYRVFDAAAFDMIRFIFRNEAEDMTLVVRRGKDIYEVKLLGLDPVRDGKLKVRTRTMNTLFDKLKELGIAYDESVAGHLKKFPGQAVEKLDLWLKADPANRNNTAWLKQFVDNYAHCVNLEWDKINIPEQNLPVPIFNRLTKLYLSLADLYRGNPKAEPMPKSHGVLIAFFMQYYPYPHRVTPEFGVVKATDEKFLGFLKSMRDGSDDDEDKRHSYANSINDGGSAANIYLGQVKKAILHPDNHGGWPYRSSQIWTKESREPVVQDLESRLKSEPENASLIAFALIGPMIHDNNQTRLLELEKMIREKSPYLAYRARQIIRLGTNFLNRVQLWEKCRVEFDKHDLYGGDASILPEWIADRTTTIDMDDIDEKELLTLKERNPLGFYEAFSRVDSVESTATDIDFAIESGSFRDDRAKYIRLGASIMKLAARSNGDYDRLVKLTEKQWQTGVLLDYTNEMLYWRFACNTGAWWMRRPGYTYYTTGENSSYQPIKDAMAAINWQDRDAAFAEVKRIYEEKGRLASTLLLADILDSKGFTQEAGFYRAKVVRYFDLVSKHYYKSEHYDKPNSNAIWSCWHALAHLSSSPATSRLAIEYGLRHVAGKEKRGEKAWDSAYLYMAQAHLQLGEVEPAADCLIASVNGTVDNQLAYFYDGGIHDSTRDYQAWLLRSIVKSDKFSDGIKEKLLDAELGNILVDEYAELFGEAATTPNVGGGEVF